MSKIKKTRKKFVKDINRDIKKYDNIVIPKMKRVVIIGDMHCGHVMGLTHPNWQYKISTEPNISLLQKVQSQSWDWYEKQARRLGPVDILIVNGDAIDGRGEKSGGTELLTSDRLEQCKMATKCIMAFRPKQVYIVRGTAYHTGNQEDFENCIKDQLSDDLKKTCLVVDMLDLTVKVGSKEVVFNIKHHIGSSSTLGGRQTAISRAKYQNMMWADMEIQKRADFVIRNHVHYIAANMEMVGGKEVWGIVNPALQIVGTNFGTKYGRRCEGTVNFGFTYYDITEEGATWELVSDVLEIQKVGKGIVA